MMPRRAAMSFLTFTVAVAVSPRIGTFGKVFFRMLSSR